MPLTLVTGGLLGAPGGLVTGGLLSGGPLGPTPTPPTIVIPSTDPRYSRAGTGWATQVSGGYQGGPFDYSGIADDTATFAFTLPAPGSYRLAIAYVADVNRSPDVGLVVEDGGTPVLTRTLDQTVAPADFAFNGSAFAWLSGPLTFATTSASVTLTVPGGGGAYTIADAAYLADATAPTPGRSTFAKPANYNDLLPPIVLTAPHAAGASTLDLPAGAGTRLGTLPADRIFRVTALSNSGTANEVVRGILDATGIVGDTLTGLTGAEGFGNIALAAGTTVEVRPTARDYEDHSVAINAVEAAVALRAVDATVVRTSGDQTIRGAKTFTDGISGVHFTSFLGGSFVILSAAGPSGIGVGTGNPWIAYCHDDGQWFLDSIAGDVAYRNTAGRLLFGTMTGAAALVIRADDTLAVGTIAVGTWHGTPIADAYIASAATWDAKQAASAYLTALTGDVSASGPGSAAATVAALRGRTVATTAPADGQVLTWAASTSEWTPVAVPGGMAMGGPVSGGTAGRILVVGAGPALADDDDLLWDAPSRALTVGATQAGLVKLGPLPGFPTFGSLWIAQASPSTTNYAMASGGPDVLINGETTLQFRIGNNTRVFTQDYRTTFGLGVGASDGDPTATVTSMAVGATYVALALDGASGQAAPLARLRGVSSTATRRDLGYLDAGFTVATDASFTGYIDLDANDFAGRRKGLRVASDGTQALIGAFGATPVARPSGDVATGLAALGWLTAPTYASSGLTGTIAAGRMPTTGLTIASHTGPITTDADGATVTFDLAATDWHSVTLGGNRTLAVANASVGQQFTVILIQDGTGGRTVSSWWSGITWFTGDGNPPAIAATAGKITVFTFKAIAAGAYYGFVAGIQS
jgi:hypothetical protein